MKRYLLVEEHPLRGRALTLVAGHVIGRAGCEIVLLDPAVSRRHALVCLLGARFAIADLSSRNGTWLNGERISGVRTLAVGDSLMFGNTVATVHEAGPRARGR